MMSKKKFHNDSFNHQYQSKLIKGLSFSQKKLLYYYGFVFIIYLYTQVTDMKFWYNNNIATRSAEP